MVYRTSQVGRVTKDSVPLARLASRRISPTDLLEHYDADNVSRETRFDDDGRAYDQFVFSCLIDRVEPHHTHGDSTPSASLHGDLLLSNCWSYGGGGLLWFLMTMEQGDERAVRRVLNKLASQTADETLDDFRGAIERLLTPTGQATEIPKYNKRVLQSWAVSHPYLYEDRGISTEVMERMDIGYDSREVKIVIPHFWRGNLVGWQKRSLSSPEYPTTPLIKHEDGSLRDPPKYQSSPSFPKNNTLYNGDNIDPTQPVFVVESPMSVLWGLTIGGEFLNIVATFGAKMTEEQLVLMRGYSRVYSCMDPDFAGRGGAYRLMKGLHKFTDVRDVTFPNGKDMAEFDPSQLRTLVKLAEPALTALPRIEKQMSKRKQFKDDYSQVQHRRKW